MPAFHDVVMAELPTGTVTMLFSDIEGSTLLLTRLGTDYAEALDGQRQVLRAAWAAHGGTEMGTEGDSFFVVVPLPQRRPSPRQSQAQRGLAAYPWPGGEHVRVRMGIHTGSPSVHDDGYVGMDVHRAARIAGAAHGGQVVVSEATAHLVRGDLPDGVGLRDLGSHQLKDIPRPEHLFQLQIEGLQADFPPLKTLGAASSLPTPPTPLVGRDGELAELAEAARLADVRLVTLTGPGGSGKTRLAIGVAQRLVDDFPDGVFFVPLAAVTTAEVMWTTIAEALDVPPEGRIPPALLHAMSRTAARCSCSTTSSSCPARTRWWRSCWRSTAGRGDRDLAASAPRHGRARAPCPAAGASRRTTAWTRPSRPARYSCSCSRPGGCGRSFTLTADNAADVAAVCRRLDGLPLALELAAARTKLLSPRALLARLDQAWTSPRPAGTCPSRQKTLRDTIAWSYDLLDLRPAGFFRRLGVFAGGADLDAIAAVVADRRRLGATTPRRGGRPGRRQPGHRHRDARRRAPHRHAGDLRAYALEGLRDAEELDDLRVRHARFYVALAERFRQRPWPENRGDFEIEHDNFREVLRWTRSPAETEADRPERVSIGLRLCCALFGFWQSFGYLSEARGWLEGSIESAGDLDRPELSDALRMLANVLRFVGEMEPAFRYATASVEMCRRLDDDRGLALSLIYLAAVEAAVGHPERARAQYEEALGWARESGDKTTLSFALADFGYLEAEEHHYEQALAMQMEALEIEREIGDPFAATMLEQDRAVTLRLMGRPQEAYDQLVDLMPRVLEINSSMMVTNIADDCAAVLAALDQTAEAVRLLGAADERRERLGTPRITAEMPDAAATVERTRQSLSEHE